jgi:hypothetical protein
LSGFLVVCLAVRFLLQAGFLGVRLVVRFQLLADFLVVERPFPCELFPVLEFPWLPVLLFCPFCPVFVDWLFPFFLLSSFFESFGADPLFTFPPISRLIEATEAIVVKFIIF